MGLSITNAGALGVLQNVNRQQGILGRTFQQQSSGLRLLRASDSPGQFVVGELLRAQISGVGEAISGTERSRALLNVAEGGLNEQSNQLTQLRSLAIQARNTTDPNQLNALQAAADATVSSVSRVAQSTRFGSQSLLSGQGGIQTSVQGNGVTGADFTQFNASSTQTLNFEVSQLAQKAQLGETFTTQAAASTIRVEGATGAQTIDVAAGATADDIAGQINAFSADTGVEAVVSGGNVTLQSVDTGSSQSAQLDVVSGNFVTSGGSTSITATGTDVQATLNGQTLQASGNTVTVDNGVTQGTVSFSENLDLSAGTSTQTVQVAGGGFDTQIGSQAGDSVNFGISSTDASSLGLSGLDLSSNDALSRIDAAINQVSGERARLGALSSQTFEPALSNLNTQFQELTATRSNIVDLNFAQSVIDQQRASILFQSGLSVLGAQQGITGGGILRLLGAG